MSNRLSEECRLTLPEIEASWSRRAAMVVSNNPWEWQWEGELRLPTKSASCFVGAGSGVKRTSEAQFALVLPSGWRQTAVFRDQKETMGPAVGVGRVV